MNTGVITCTKCGAARSIDFKLGDRVTFNTCHGSSDCDACTRKNKGVKGTVIDCDINKFIIEWDVPFACAYKLKKCSTTHSRLRKI
jgi:hypothetical protein